MSKLVGGICFSLGLILCVLLGAELFTSTTLTLVAKAANRISWAQLLKNWGLVYLATCIGGLIMSASSSCRQPIHGSGWSVGAERHESGPSTRSITPLSRPWPLASSATSWCVSPPWMAFGARSATDKVMVMLFPSPCSWLRRF